MAVSESPYFVPVDTVSGIAPSPPASSSSPSFERGTSAVLPNRPAHGRPPPFFGFVCNTNKVDSVNPLKNVTSNISPKPCPRLGPVPTAIPD